MVITVGCIINPESSLALVVGVAKSQALSESGHNTAGGLLPEDRLGIRGGLDTAVDGVLTAARSTSEDGLSVVRWAGGGSLWRRAGGGSLGGCSSSGGAGAPSSLSSGGGHGDESGGGRSPVNPGRVNPGAGGGGDSRSLGGGLGGGGGGSPVGPWGSGVWNPETNSSVGDGHGAADTSGGVNGVPVIPSRRGHSGINRLDGGAGPVGPSVARAGGGIDLLGGRGGGSPVKPWVDSGRGALGWVDFLGGGGGRGPVEPGVNRGAGGGIDLLSGGGGGGRGSPVEPWGISAGGVDRLGGCGGGAGGFPGHGGGGHEGGGQQGRGRFDHHD